MHESKWVVFDKNGKKVKTVIIKHKDGRLYNELEAFENDIIAKGMYAHAYECLNQVYLIDKSFKEKLKCLGWQFDNKGQINCFM